MTFLMIGQRKFTVAGNYKYNDSKHSVQSSLKSNTLWVTLYEKIQVFHSLLMFLKLNPYVKPTSTKYIISVSEYFQIFIFNLRSVENSVLYTLILRKPNPRKKYKIENKKNLNSTP